MKKNLLLPILFVCCLFSCEREPDFSKTLQEYYDFGLPKIERNWSYEELEVSAKLLGRMKQKDSFPLPKLNSRKSFKYFEKILSAMPRLSLEDSLSYRRKARDFNFMQKMVQRFVQVYGTSEKEQKYYSNEFMALNKLVLEEVAKMTLLYYDFIEQASPEYADQLSANSATFQNGVLTVLEATLENHQDHFKYNSEDKIALARTFSEHIEKIWHLIDIDSKERLLTQIQNIAQQNEIRKVRNIYSEFLESVGPKDH